MKSHVLFFNQVDRSSLPYVGGKGANLGGLGEAIVSGMVSADLYKVKSGKIIPGVTRSQPKTK